MSDIVSKICDCHVHYGQFREKYHSAEYVMQQLAVVGIRRACVMPTGFYSRKEFFECLEELKKFPSEEYDSFLWLSPRILRWLSVEKLFSLHNFKAIKIHLVAHPEWCFNQEKIDEVADFAAEVGVPIMFHTGDFYFCEPKVFEPICRRHPKTTFIFAHARPVEQTIDAMKRNKNIWADTAFTPIEDVKKLVEEGFPDRLLWGTDFPIFSTKEDTRAYYLARIAKFQATISKDILEKILWSNYLRLFR